MPVEQTVAGTVPVPPSTPDDDLAAFIASPELQAQMQALTQQAMAGLDALVDALRRAGEELASAPAPVPPEVLPPEVVSADTLAWQALPFDPRPGFIIPDLSIPGGYPAGYVAGPVVKAVPEAVRLAVEDIREDMLAGVLPPDLSAGLVAAAPSLPGGPLDERPFATDWWDSQQGAGGEGGPI